MMQTDWTIQGRSGQCAATGREFTDGEFFYALLFRERDGFRREDLSEEAWKERQADAAAAQPYSFWRSKFEPPAPAAPVAEPSGLSLTRKRLPQAVPAVARTATRAKDVGWIFMGGAPVWSVWPSARIS